jgi:capsular exopolysaccharide synthesis family protein
LSNVAELLASTLRKAGARADSGGLSDALRPSIEALAERLGNPPTGSLFCVGIASCSAGEGATTIAAEVARRIQHGLGRRVLLVDANFARPRLHQLFDIARSPGLSELLAGRRTLRDVVQPVDESGLHLIAAGAPSPDAMRYFDSHLIETMKDRLGEAFDIIIFDCAPLSGGAETLVLAKRLDGLLLVLAAERTRWESGARTMEQLRAANVNVLGAALNGKKFFIPRAIYKRL